MTKFLSKRDFFSVFASVLLSVFMVAVVAYGATMTISSGGVGSGTSTPGGAIGAKGAGIFEGLVHADYFTSTSTNISWIMGNFGHGTTTPGAKVGVKGGVVVDDFVYMSSFTATSTTATSTTRFGMTLASTSIIDGYSGRVAIGTTTIPDADVASTMALDPSLTVTGVGAANNATGTVYIAGGVGSGGQIILKSANGANCISIMADSVANAVGAVGGAADFLSVDVVECPR